MPTWLNSGQGLLTKLHRFLRRLEVGLLVGLLLLMIVVAAYQVLARNLVGGGVVWGDPLVRIALLWITLVGAMVAVGSDSHIRIDVVARFASDRLQRVIARATNLFAGCMCGILGWSSLTFIQWEYSDQTLAFGVVPAWICQLIIPVAATVMALRYAVQAATGRPVSGDEKT
jgi:TRAP-type C4-dicarboxylate transport system permease small subunit